MVDKLMLNDVTSSLHCTLNDEIDPPEMVDAMA